MSELWEDEKQEPGKEGEVKRWLSEIELSAEIEEQWEKDAEEAINVFRGDKFKAEDEGKRKETFNILYSNIEAKRPALYNSTPRPDIRRRHKDPDNVGKWVSMLLERCVTYITDCSDLDNAMVAAVNDVLLPGRAVTRIKYVPMSGNEDESIAEETTEGTYEAIDYEEVQFEQVDWKKFRRGGGNKWDDVTWIAFEHHLTKSQFEDRWPDFVEHITFDVTEKDFKEKDSYEKGSDSSMFKRTKVWEIWDKEEREVIFISDTYKDQPLEKVEDPLNLIDFFPIPRPLYAIEGSTSLVPLCEYTMYETLAKELEHLTNRIRKIINTVRVRAVYDASFTELAELFESDDAEAIPAENASMYLDKGGLSNAIWMLPVMEIAQTLEILQQRRDALIGSIYEITGISDIMRGQSNPYETKGAQEIKASMGSGRMQRQQKDVQRYARDLIRLCVEVIADKFSRETLTLMSGLTFPTEEQRAQARQYIQQAQSQYQQMAQMAQAQKQKPPPPPQLPKQLLEMSRKPSWEEIEEIMKSDIAREYRIDVETDSTIENEINREKRDISEAVVSLGRFTQSMQPMLEMRFIDQNVMKTMIKSVARRFKFGREVEDAIDGMTPPKGNPKMDAEKQRAQAQAKVDQMRVQVEARDKQMKSQAEQAKMQMEAQKSQFDQQLKVKETELAQQKIAMEQAKAQYENALATQKLQSDEALKMQELQSKERLAAQQEANKRDIAAMEDAFNREKLFLETSLKFYDVQMGHNPSEENWNMLDNYAKDAQSAKENLEGALNDLSSRMAGEVARVEARAIENGNVSNLHMTNLLAELKRPKTVARDEEGRIIGIE